MVLFYILIVLATFVVMEGVTWLTHKYVMHGFLWVLHEDHHDLVNETTFEKNDAFFIIFATPSILLFYLGFNPTLNYMFFIGLGIFFYGMAYFLVHDVYIHHRFNWLKNISNKYLRATVKAHADHHIKGRQSNFGFLIAPIEYYKQEFKK